MIHVHVPWTAVSVGTEVVGPAGDLWTVTGREGWAAMVERRGEVKEVTFGHSSLCTVALRDLDEAVALIEQAIPGAQQIGAQNGLGEWFAPLELTPDALQAHLHAFHHEISHESPKASSAVYGWHAQLHRLSPPVGVPHAHV